MDQKQFGSILQNSLGGNNKEKQVKTQQCDGGAGVNESYNENHKHIEWTLACYAAQRW